MAKYTDNTSNITFNNVTEIGSGFGMVPISKTDNYTFNAAETDITAVNKKVLNAIDIDWNSAQLSTAVNALTAPEGISHNTITTTGELIDEVAHLRAQVDALTTLVKSLYAALAE